MRGTRVGLSRAPVLLTALQKGSLSRKLHKRNFKRAITHFTGDFPVGIYFTRPTHAFFLINNLTNFSSVILLYMTSCSEIRN